MFKGDISVSFRDGHPPNSGGVYMPIIRFPYERWDDHPRLREFLKQSSSQIALGRTHLVRNLRNSTYIGQPLFGFCWNSCVCVRICIYLYIQSQRCTQKMQKHILECVHIYVYMLYTICWAIGEQVYAPAHFERTQFFFRTYVLFSASVHLSCALVQAMVAKNWRNLATESHGFPSLPQLPLTTQTGTKTHEASPESIDKPSRFLMLNLSSLETLVVGYILRLPLIRSTQKDVTSGWWFKNIDVYQYHPFMVYLLYRHLPW